MENVGWIKLHRKILQWEWYDDPLVFRLFLHLLLTVNLTDKNWHGIPVNKGQIITSYPQLTRQLTGKQQAKIGVQQVRTAIARLKSTGELTVKTTNKYSIITIQNYDTYQTANTLANRPVTGKQQSTNSQLTSTKEDKEVKNEKNISKDITTTSFGNQDINLIIDYLKEQLGGSLDDSVTTNRQYAHLLIKRMAKDYPDKSPVEQIKALIGYGLQDQFHAKNLTNFKYLFYNSQKIIQSTKQQLSKKPKFIKIN